MKILITGINGFVGSNLVQDLKNEHILYGLDIITPEIEGVRHTYSWDDLDKELIDDIDTIIHLAGIAHDTKNQTKEEDYISINTKLTQKVFDYFLKSSASKFIFFSSVKAVADFVQEKVLYEDVVPNPKGPYGVSKLMAEDYIMKHLPTNKSVYILRPSMIHGPGNKGNLNLLFKVIQAGIPWPLGAFENKRSFTSIDNLCFIIENIVIKNIPTGVYNIADDEAISTTELIHLICSVLNKKARVWRLPKLLISIFASIGSVLRLKLNTDRLNKLTENYLVSNSKIKKALDIDSMPVRAKDGLIKTIKSFSKC